jgi:hypothetical protein
MEFVQQPEPWLPSQWFRAAQYWWPEQIDWTGPIGRNDRGRLPYFKIGVYNPSGLVTGTTEVQFRNYSQSWKSDDSSLGNCVGAPQTPVYMADHR